MRTTLRLDDDLMTAVKRRAAERGTTLTSVIEDALRASLAREPRSGGERISLTTFGEGGLEPGVDLDDSARLAELMDRG